jgi:hypothetical protein
MAYSVMLNILTNNTDGFRHQLKTILWCGNCELNNKLTKISYNPQTNNHQTHIIKKRPY